MSNQDPGDKGSSTFKRVWNKISGNRSAKAGHGPWAEASSGYVDAKPYMQYWSNGIFEGYDGSIWKYYKIPENVQIDWLQNPNNVLDNQYFFVNICKRLGDMLDSQTDKTRGDIRRPFHIQVTQTPSEGIKPYDGCTPAHSDYLSRMSEQYKKPEWFGFMGIRLLPTTIFYEAYGAKAYLTRYMEMLKDPDAVQWELFKKDIDDVDAIMLGDGFREVDFISDPIDFEQLTAWHGISDEQYGLPRQLQNTRMKEPIQGLSIITPKWGEIMFHAMKPMDGNDIQDPLVESARWAVPLYRPGSNVVLVNIRGQIRAPSISDNLLDVKKVGRTEKLQKKMDHDRSSVTAMEIIQLARASVTEYKLPMLDNLEIIVGSLVPPVGQTTPLPSMMKRYGLTAAPLVGRQHLGVLTSMPTYPRHVLRIPRGNRKRPELTNVMLPGLLAMSGLFRNTRPCAPRGVLMGLSDSGDQFREIYTETDAASRYNRVPGMLITGRPGAGKALALDTPIMTPDGPKTMGDITIGDTVYGSDGQHYTVTFVTPVMHDHECFLITLADGQAFVADADHQWVVQVQKDRDWNNGEDQEYIQHRIKMSHKQEGVLRGAVEMYNDSQLSTLDELYEKVSSTLKWYGTPWKTPESLRYALGFNDTPYHEDEQGVRLYSVTVALKSLALRLSQQRMETQVNGRYTRRLTTGEMVSNLEHMGRDRYSVPLAAPVQYPEQDLPVNPYVLGLWLGDGTTGHGRITSGSVGASLDSETGVSDQQEVLRELLAAGYDAEPATYSAYLIKVRGLVSGLREIGVLHNKHVPEMYLRSSVEQRIALLQGMMDSDGQTNRGMPGFTNTNLRLVEDAATIARSLGIKVLHQSCEQCGARCDCEYPVPPPQKNPVTLYNTPINPTKASFGISFSTTIPMFRIQRKLNKQNLDPGIRGFTNIIKSIEPVDSVPVQCISVDSPDHTYLIGDGTVTSNTQQLLQVSCQIAYQGLPVVFFNPKKEGSLQPTFDHLGALTISMNWKYLRDNPGMLDPMFFLSDRREAAQVLADAILLANRMYDDQGSKANQRRTKVKTEIIDRAQDPRNKCSADVIFGNRAKDPSQRTEALTDEEVVEFVQNRMKISPFWMAFVATSERASALLESMNRGSSILIEWDKSMQLPDSSLSQRDYSDAQLDTVISVNVSFNYASAIVGGTGGAIVVDEAWVLKTSREALAILERGGREWRQANIMLIMGTQKITDWASGSTTAGGSTINMRTYFDRYLFMAISENDPEELKAYFELTGLPHTQFNEHYITNAGATRSPSGKGGNIIPRAYYMDNIYSWAGGVICGPWPEKELNLGRTDKEGLARLKESQEANIATDKVSSTKELFSGILGEVVDENIQRDIDLGIIPGDEEADDADEGASIEMETTS